MAQQKVHEEESLLRFSIRLGCVLILLTAVIVLICLVYSNANRIGELTRRVDRFKTKGATSLSANEKLEILEKVDGFYSRAWVMLIGAAAIGGVIVGIIVPAVLAKLQQHSFEKTEEHFRTDAYQVREDFRAEIATMREGFANELKSLEKQVTDNARRELYAHAGAFFGQQAEHEYKTGVVGISVPLNCAYAVINAAFALGLPPSDLSLNDIRGHLRLDMESLAILVADHNYRAIVAEGFGVDNLLKKLVMALDAADVSSEYEDELQALRKLIREESTAKEHESDSTLPDDTDA